MVGYGKLLSNFLLESVNAGSYLWKKARHPMKIKTFLKKLLSLGLCLLLTLTTLSGAALAVETFTTSDAGVAMIEELEGYRQMPYVGTNGKWYVGYGLECDPADYPAGISPEEAERLLREHLIQDEAWVNGFLTQYGISVTQYQFDALISLTYTLGSQWINPSYRLCAYLINGIGNYSEEQVVNAIATWCHSGGDTILENLVNRRLREAFLFLYGQYENDGPLRYCYIDYETNGGTKDPAQNSRTIFYPIGAAYGSLPAPTMAGKTFQGWYTADGIQLTGAEVAMGSLYVYARWGEGGGGTAPAVPTEPTEQKPDYSTWTNPYSDVKEGDWYYTYVRELNYHNIVSGYPDGTFQPNNMLSAGEALKLLLVAATKTDPGAASSGHWAATYLALAESLGCVTPGGITDLDAPIDRLSIAGIAAIAMGLQPVTGPTPFADVDNGYTLALYEAGIITGDTAGSQRVYNPGGSITRAEMCTIVSRIRGYKTPNNPALSGYIEYGNKQIPVLWNVPAAPYNRDLFVRDGSRMYYNDPAYTTAIGIDVSSHQKEIDWQKVADSGVEFAMIRLGYRGYGSEGTLNMDPYFQQNLIGAAAAGLKIGVYFYSQAISAAEAAEEAQFVLDALGGFPLTYPVVYDWETVSADGARTKGLDNTILTDCAITFCESVAAAGYGTMIYYNLPVGYNHYQLDRLTAYDKWFAQYTSKNQPDMYYDYRIWQYTDSGSVPGIEGKVDMNLAFLPYY